MLPDLVRPLAVEETAKAVSGTVSREVWNFV